MADFKETTDYNEFIGGDEENEDLYNMSITIAQNVSVALSGDYQKECVLFYAVPYRRFIPQPIVRIGDVNGIDITSIITCILANDVKYISFSMKTKGVFIEDGVISIDPAKFDGTEKYVYAQVSAGKNVWMMTICRIFDSNGNIDTSVHHHLDVNSIPRNIMFIAENFAKGVFAHPRHDRATGSVLEEGFVEVPFNMFRETKH